MSEIYYERGGACASELVGIIGKRLKNGDHDIF